MGKESGKMINWSEDIAKEYLKKLEDSFKEIKEIKIKKKGGAA